MTDKIEMLVLESGGITSTIAVGRITALWALSEALLGGFLHGLHFPFRGLIISSASVLCISLIYYFSKSPLQIIKSALLVMIVKFVVSPHTPFMAYLALSYQAAFAYLFYKFIPLFKLSSLLLAVTVLAIGGIQKIFTLTIIFGFDLWKSINNIATEIFVYFGISSFEPESVNISLIIGSVYILIHVVAGIIVGLTAGKIPVWINNSYSEKIYRQYLSFEEKNNSDNVFSSEQKIHHRKNFRFEIIILIFIAILFISTFYFDKYFFETLPNFPIMIIRAVSILIIWYKIINPFLIKLLSKFLQKSKWKRANEIDQIVRIFPQLKSIVSYSWKISAESKNPFARFRSFVSSTIHLTLITELSHTQK